MFTENLEHECEVALMGNMVVQVVIPMVDSEMLQYPKIRERFFTIVTFMVDTQPARCGTSPPVRTPTVRRSAADPPQLSSISYYYYSCSPASLFDLRIHISRIMELPAELFQALMVSSLIGDSPAVTLCA